MNEIEDPATKNWPEEEDIMPDPVKPAPIVAPPVADPPTSLPASVPGPQDEFSNLSPEELKAALKSTRAEAAERRRSETELKRKLEEKELKENEANEKALAEQGKYKELAEKREKELIEQRMAFQTRLIDERMRAVARAAGLVDLDLIDKISREGVSVDAAGNIIGIESAVEAYKKAKPVLFTIPTQPIIDTGNEPPPPAETHPPNTETDVRKMSPEAYKKYKAEQSKVWKRDLAGTSRINSGA